MGPNFVHLSTPNSAAILCRQISTDLRSRQHQKPVPPRLLLLRRVFQFGKTRLLRHLAYPLSLFPHFLIPRPSLLIVGWNKSAFP